MRHWPLLERALCMREPAKQYKNLSASAAAEAANLLSSLSLLLLLRCCITCAAEKNSEIMETIEGTAIYPPSVLQHVNGLVIPGGQESYTSSYKCGRRCTYVPLGRLSPQPVTIAGYTFHGHHFMTGTCRAWGNHCM
jgi:hypothetical protein